MRRRVAGWRFCLPLRRVGIRWAARFVWHPLPQRGKTRIRRPAEILLIPVAVPPLAEQTRIVAEAERRLSVVEELESVVSTKLQRATRLRQSVLQKAFAGEL